MPIIKNTGKTYLKGEGYERLRLQAAMSVKLFPEIDANFRSVQNRNHFIRELVSFAALLAIAEKLQKEDLMKFSSENFLSF